jgi:hypothetical protein
MIGTNGTTVSTSLLPVRHWWQQRFINVDIRFDCGTRMMTAVPLKWALAGLNAVRCPKCVNSTVNLIAAETLAAVVAADFKRTAEKN